MSVVFDPFTGQIIDTGSGGGGSGGITELTGDVTAGPGSGSQSATISPDSVDNTKLAQMPASSIKGNDSGIAGSPSDLSAAQVNTLLGVDIIDGEVDDLISLSGVPANSTDLGTFTGTTIPDASTVKVALQSLETAHEEVDQNVNDLITLSGVPENSVNLGTFTGSTIPDNSTNKSALQSLETAQEEIDQNVNDLITLSGMPENSVDLGTFTGSIIPDNSTNKVALQSLETSLEEVDQNVNDLITLSGVAENSVDLGTFTGAIIPDNSNVKQALQALESESEIISGSAVTSLTGDVTGTGPGATATTISNDVVTNAKLANMSSQTFKGRTSGGAGDPEDLTAAQATAILNNFVGDTGTGGTKGLVPAPSSGDAAANKYLRADGIFFAPITQTVSSGNLVTAPSEDAVFNQLALKESLANKNIAGGYPGLDGGGKILASQLPNSVMELQGNWDASTNTPTLIDGTGNPGDVYEVTVGGTQNLGSGNITFAVGDWAVYAASGIWYKSINSNAVTSVNGFVGTVVLTTDNVNEGITNQYYTQLRARTDAVADTIVNGTVDVAPSQNAVYDALQLKQDVGNYITALTGDISATGPGSVNSTIQANVVSNSKLAQMPAHTFKGNNTGSTANASDLTATQLTAELNLFTSGLQGLVPASGGGTTNFLRADGTFATPPDTGITQLTGDVTAGPGSGSQAATIPNNTVTNAKLADMAANTVKANITGSTTDPSDISAVTTATASSFMVRDSNANVKINNHIENLATTATAAGTTTLTVSSAKNQQFTGSTTQTVVLPDATTLSVGHSFIIMNRSTGSVTVNANGGGLIRVMAPSSQMTVSAVTIGTSAGTWDAAYSFTTESKGVTAAISASDIDWSAANLHTKTLAANTTFTFSNQSTGYNVIVVRLTNTASNFTVTWPTVKWSGGVAPTMTTGATSDIYTFAYDGTNTYGSYVQDVR
jgi:hypothetical protein